MKNIIKQLENDTTLETEDKLELLNSWHQKLESKIANTIQDSSDFITNVDKLKLINNTIQVLKGEMRCVLKQ